MSTFNSISLMEDTFSNYLAATSDTVIMCKNLTVCLNSLPFEVEKTFSVYVTNESMKENFFGFRVFPAIKDAVDNFAGPCISTLFTENSRSLVDWFKSWKEIHNWVVEIDASVFNITGINFTPKELTALLLHELGHVIYSEGGLTYLYDALQCQRSKLTTREKAIYYLVPSMYLLPISKMCMQRGWVNDENVVKTQMLANETIFSLGYGEYLETAFNKILLNCGTIRADKNKDYAEVYTYVEWCTKNIKDVVLRREHLRDSLYYEAVRTSSSYVKAVVIEMLSVMGMKLRENYKGYAVENTIGILSDPDVMKTHKPTIDILVIDKLTRIASGMESNVIQAISVTEKMTQDGIALEAILNKRRKIKAVLPSQYELDMIAVEVDKITNHHDRIFVLDLIYEVLERINIFEEAISSDPSLVRKWDAKIKMMKDEIERLRQATLNKKNFSKGYKFFVKLPPEASDYEG